MLSALVDRHGVGPRTPSALRRLLAETRRRGYAVEDGEVTPGLASVAAVGRDHNGHPMAGLAVTFPEGEPERLSRPVIAAARALTERLGGV